MYRYLSGASADYTATIFEVKPTTILPQTGDKKQVAHEFDDGTISIVGISTSVYFDVELRWAYISDANHDILIDFWFNETKGAGRRRTFLWKHPVDGHIYVVRFSKPLTTSYEPTGHLSISPVVLRIEGAGGIVYADPWTVYTDIWSVAYTAAWL